MDAARSDKLRQIVFERLTVGESPDVLRQELLKKLEGTAADAMLDGAGHRISDERAAGTYETAARRIRLRHFRSDYGLWKILAVVLIGWGVIGSLGSSIENGAWSVAWGPLVMGAVILLAIDIRVNGRVTAATEAVEARFETDPAA